MPRVIACAYGGSTSDHVSASDVRPGYPHGVRVRCNSCGLMSANPQATEEEIYRSLAFGRERAPRIVDGMEHTYAFPPTPSTSVSARPGSRSSQ